MHTSPIYPGIDVVYSAGIVWLLWKPDYLAVVCVDELTGLKHYPFKLSPVPRLNWEDPAADHLMTHEVSALGGWGSGWGKRCVIPAHLSNR